MNFHQHNKMLVKRCIQCHHDCWKLRCVVLHDPEVQIKVLKDELLSIMEDASKDEVE